MIRAPSDAKRLVDGDDVRVGGRVIAMSGDGVVIADALGTVDVETVSPRCAAGDFAVFRGTLREKRLVGATLESLHASSRPDGDDVRRFLLGGAGARLARRADLLRVVRRSFARDEFVEVETPILVPSPGLDLHLDAVAAEGGFLITSPEYQMKRLVAGGLPRCFQLVRCFRKDERGALHNPEFTMLEWYEAFASYDDVMTRTERVVAEVVSEGRGAPCVTVGGRTISVEPPLPRITVAEAYARFAATDEAELLRLAHEDEDELFRRMVDGVEPALAAMDTGVFLVDYPAPQASLARKKPADPRFAERFELYVGGVELCNGFGELTDPVEQRARLEHDRDERARRGLPAYPIDEAFLAALEAGLPPCAGNALGVDRLVALALGASSIGDVQAFPAGAL